MIHERFVVVVDAKRGDLGSGGEVSVEAIEGTTFKVVQASQHVKEGCSAEGGGVQLISQLGVGLGIAKFDRFVQPL